ncbi:MAG: glycosyltransferase family 1 protein [Bacteroidota bacterium]
MRIVLYFRKPYPYNFSIENVFRDVINGFNGNIEPKIFTSSLHSKGLMPRLKNAFEAKAAQGDINHITGDIHYIAPFLEKKKTILTIHDCNFMNRSSALKRFMLKTFWLDIPVKASEVVTVISEATKAEVLRYIDCPEEKIRIIPDAISTDFQFDEKPFNEKEPVLLQIGTKSNKNIPRLAEAISGIKCRLEIVGPLSDELRMTLEKFRIKYNNSINLSQKEIVEKYRQCDLLTFVSTSEGFGMPIIEAQATGRPVITSNCSSMPEVAGNSASLVDPFSVEDIRIGILKIIEDRSYREELIEKGRKNAMRFDPQVIADMYADLYREIYSRNIKNG